MNPRCNAHGTPMILTEVERGKTIYVCAACETERQAKLAVIFGAPTEIR